MTVYSRGGGRGPYNRDHAFWKRVGMWLCGLVLLMFLLMALYASTY